MVDNIYTEENPDVGVDWRYLPSTLPKKGTRGTLTPQWTQALRLMVFDGLNQSQAAIQTGLTPQAMCKGLKRPFIIKAMQQLKKEYAQQIAPETIQEWARIKKDAMTVLGKKAKSEDYKPTESVAIIKSCDEQITAETMKMQAFDEGEAAKEIVYALNDLPAELKEQIVRHLSGLKPRNPESEDRREIETGITEASSS